MTRAKVSDLKAHLSAYLADVRRGKSIIVCDRATPIARLVPYDESPADDFRVEEPSRAVTAPARLGRVHLRKKVDVVRLLRESRDQR
jgi:prevent-host-death family protein